MARRLTRWMSDKLIPGEATGIGQTQDTNPDEAAEATRRYDLRKPKDTEGFQWLVPSSTINPSRPRTLVIGYNEDTQTVRTIFRDHTRWRYDNVSPQEWETLTKQNSTGRYIASVLDHHPYGPDRFGWPTT